MEQNATPRETGSSLAFAAALPTRGRVQFLREEPAKTFATLKSHERQSMLGHGQSVPKGKNGLAAWQEIVLARYIEKHLTEPIRTRALARFVCLSSYGFLRAFKRSFGIPPLRNGSVRSAEKLQITPVRKMRISNLNSSSATFPG